MTSCESSALLSDCWKFSYAWCSSEPWWKKPACAVQIGRDHGRQERGAPMVDEEGGGSGRGG
jgi:hypothetical protein